MNWSYGTLVTPPTPDEPDSLGDDDSIASLLDQAEEIVRQAGPTIMAEVERDRASQVAARSSATKGLPARVARIGEFLRRQRNRED